ncbi:mitochondrial 37S ribosomal protein uS15m MRPS28 [Sporobolomyces salmoneus]|uniref:mitochondrial 37S ribosomal protein uS15m MRPS28 n=1 Tax=Sporobolomyces salmoneus TaxID=183962 RepID=UPI00317439CB
MLLRRAVQAVRTPLIFTPSPSPSSSSVSPASTRAFSSTPSTSESRARRKTRLVRKANLEKKSQLIRLSEQSRPDPVFGYAKGNEQLWENSLLNKILLNKDKVWGKIVKGEGETRLEGEEAQGQQQLYNFGLDQETARELSTVLPATAALRSTLGDGQTSVDSVMLNRFEQATELEEQKKETLMRIIDLRNADSKGIEVENTRRIVENFGRVPGDTASPEVQAAILTARIHSLSSHLVSSPRDVQNRQALRQLVSKRAKILKYLRTLSVTRYEECLEKIGVESRAVEGEVIVRKEELRSFIRGQ